MALDILRRSPHLPSSIYFRGTIEFRWFRVRVVNDANAEAVVLRQPIEYFRAHSELWPMDTRSSLLMLAKVSEPSKNAPLRAKGFRA